MFELSFVKKYLTPRKKQLSVSLIALLSIAVITLVVWLVVLFLSVTEGIERNWLNKLTALNAPVRLQPTPEYFSSYYYKVDQYSAASQYMSQTLGQKAQALISDPYNPEFDEGLPMIMAKPDLNQIGQLKDPVKMAFSALEELKASFPGLAFQDIEMSGALLRLELLRQETNSLTPVEMQSQLTNVSYLSSLPEKNPSLQSLLLAPTEEDLNHLLYLSERSDEDPHPLFSHSHIEKLKTRSDLWQLPFDLLPEKIPFEAQAYKHEGEISHLIVPTTSSKEASCTIERRADRLFFKCVGDPEVPLNSAVPLFSYGNVEFDVKEMPRALLFSVKGKLQKKTIAGTVPFTGLQVSKASFDLTVDSLCKTGKQTGILLAKNFRENGLRMGDAGYLAYSAPTLSGTKQLQIPVYVAGFYDPGIMAVGNKCILVPPHITQSINASESAFTLDRGESNNIFVWMSHLNDAQKLKEALLEKFQEKGIDKYWTVQTYREYDFAKDLMQQFQSDKYLFTLIGMIILLVACSNIISLLVLLVSDKKKEIGILRAMGAKRRSIAAIFAFCGASLGLFSCLLGILLAFVTLRNIDSVVHFLSVLQGHEAFNTQFFGQSLPHEISSRALIFAAIATPLLSLIAGLVPAIKAARLDPCETLRSE